jgi:hypothetical protein
MLAKLGVLLLAALVLALCGYLIYVIFPHLKQPDEAVAIVVTGFVAGIIALWGVYSQRAITRRQATIEHIARLEADGDQIRARRKLNELVKAGHIAQWAELDKRETAEFQAICTVLNEMELISIGIQRGIIDYELYQRWFKTGVIRRWDEALPFVHSLRVLAGDNPMLYHEFQTMAGWFNDNKPPRRHMWAGIWS